VDVVAVLLSLSFAAFSVIVDDCNLELYIIFSLLLVNVGIAKELGVMNADDKHI